MQQQKQEMVLYTKPKRSINLQTIAKPTNLTTNLFTETLSGNGNGIVHLYSFVVDELNQAEVSDSRSIERKIFLSIKKELEKIFGQNFIQRGQNFYCSKKVDKMTILTGKVDNNEYTVRISWRKEVDLKQAESIEGTGNIVSQILNVRTKQAMKECGLIEIGRNSKFYNLNEVNKFPVGGQGLNVWRGYKTSTVLCPNSTKILLDFNSRVLRQETALDFLYRQEFTSDQMAAEAITGLSVMAFYGNHRVYRVDGVLYDQNPLSTFDYHDGTKMSYKDYFKKQYGITIKDLKQPLLKHKDKKTEKEIVLIPELMKMTGLTDQQRNNGRLMQAVAQFTKLNAQQRMQYIVEFAQRIQQNMSKQGVQIDGKSNKAQGYTLYPPKLALGQNKSLQPQAGGFDLKQNPVLKGGKLDNWVLIYQSRGSRDDDEADDFVYGLKKASVVFGIKIEDPAGYITVKSNKPADWISELDRDIKANGTPTFIISLISGRDKSTLYAPLKKYLYQQNGVPHQNVVLDSLRKNRMSVLSKIVLQINAKLAYPLWKVQIPTQVGNNTMIIGIDQYHKAIKGKDNCVGFVASIDEDFTQYYSQISMQPRENPKKKEEEEKEGQQKTKKREEAPILTHKLTSLIKNAINEYVQKNGKNKIPENIVVFRDGVGEGQVDTISKIEVDAIQQGFKLVNENYKPKLAYIMINTKINHRFFSEQTQSDQGRGGKGYTSGGLQNPDSGTILADSICSSKFEYFLASQNVRQGTCTPTRYLVVYNSTEWSEETFWQLSYFQCFNYYNWSGAVKVPAPVQYAHKLSYLVGETFQSNPHEELTDCLYYL